ncbi:MAG: hypothetical protein WBD74_05480 [Candidatus Aquilonibacter sp.]
MKRAGFLAVASAVIAVPALSASPTTAVLLSSSSSDLDSQYLDFVAGALRARGVNVYDPSSADISYHERASLVAEAVGSILVAEVNGIAWVEAHYHTRRAMFIETHISASSLPYGDFTVHMVRATSAYRCFDTSTRAVIAAGTARGEARGEDLDTATQQAGNRSLQTLAADAASKLA